MASIFKKRRFRKAMQEIGRHPARVIDWLVISAVGLLLVWMVFRLGGYPLAGWPLRPALVLLGVIVVLHGAARIFRHKVSGLHPWALAPLPLLAWGYLSQANVSTSPAFGETLWLMWLAAYLLFFVTLHTAQTRPQQFAFIGVLSGCLAVVLAGAFREAYIAPHWFPRGDRLRAELIVEGHGGYLALPDAVAAMVLFLLPVFLIGALVPRFDGPVRILMGFGVFVCCFGLLVAGAFSAIQIALVVALVVPFFATPLWRPRRRYWMGLVGAAALVTGFVWLVAPPIKDRALAIHAQEQAAPTEPFAQAAWKMLGENPLVGQGLGSFGHRWDHFGDAQMRWAPLHADNTWADLGAETGLVGLLLAALTAIFLLTSTFRKWWATPFESPEEERELEELQRKLGHSRRGRRRRRRGPKRVPSQKLMLGALLLSVVATLAFAYHFSVAESPLVLFFLAVGLGVMGRFTRGDDTDWPEWTRSRWLLAIVPLGLVALLIHRGMLVLAANQNVFEGKEQLTRALANPDALFFDADPLWEAVSSLETALELRPDHLDALVALAWARLNRVHVDDRPMAEVGAEALEVVEAGLALDHRSGILHFYKAVALGFMGRPWSEVEAAFERAVNLAPNRVQVLTGYAQFIYANNESMERAVALLDRALRIEPEFRAALDLRGRILL